MSGKGGFLKRAFGSNKDQTAPAVPGAGEIHLPYEAEGANPTTFGVYGEKGETVGEHISYFLSRLDDLQRLKIEFTSIAEPISDFIRSHAEAQTRLAEATAVLSRERSEAQTLRFEAQGLRTAQSTLEAALADANSRLKTEEEAAESRGARLRTLQITHDETLSKLDWTTRQLALEARNSQEQAEAQRTMASDLSRLEQEIATERARSFEARDHYEGVGAEMRRLQALVDRLQPNLAVARRRVSELEAELGASATTVGMLELKLAGESDLRRAAEAARAQDKVAFESEITNLGLQLESFESRHQSTSKLFEQSRSLLNEKIDEIRQADRIAKDAVADKAGAERRFASAQDEIRRLQEQAALLGGRNSEMGERCAMLTKAAAAKDAQLEQYQGRYDAVKQQLDDAVTRHELERVAVEAANRKLIEEVQTERAERALAQGALTIARGSREKLLAQMDELKRGRLGHSHDAETDMRADASGRDEHNNVHRFRSSEPMADGA